MNRLYLDIHKEVGSLQAVIHRGDAALGEPIQLSGLNPDDQITIDDRRYSLRKLCNNLLQFNTMPQKPIYDDLGQAVLGGYLFDQTLGMLEDPPTQAAELVILTDDSWIASLPWPLMNRDGVFLVSSNWSMSLSPGLNATNVELPPDPRLLLLLTEPKDRRDNDAQNHQDELVNMLSRGGALVSPSHIKVLHEHRELEATLAGFKPHVVYYFGPSSEHPSPGLSFLDGHLSMTQFTDCLRANPPLAAYLNCYQGKAADILAVAGQLSKVIPAVIHNRTTATVNAARAQGRAVLERLLLRGDTPETAVADIYNRIAVLGDPDLKQKPAHPHWFTPVLHLSYQKWTGNPPPADRSGFRAVDTHWHLKVDRRYQFALVHDRVQEMISLGKPKGHCLIWAGGKGQGVGIFRDRLEIQLQERLDQLRISPPVYTVEPQWPDHHVRADNAGYAFIGMMCHAFEVGDFEAIPGRIRENALEGRVLIYLKHPTVPNRRVLDMTRLGWYLEWLDHHFTPLLEVGQHLLVGLSFEPANPQKFLKQAASYRADHLAVMPLLELGDLVHRDLTDFLDTHNIYIPKSEIDQVLTDILRQTGGAYEATLHQLEKLIRAGGAKREDSTSTDGFDEDDIW